MGRIITHEPLAAGLFNTGYCGANSFSMAWQVELSNSKELLQLLCERMRSDYCGQNPKMRRPYTSKELDPCIVRCVRFFTFLLLRCL